MATREAIAEFRAVWLPNVSETGLARLTSMLEAGSPYLIHGTFARAVPQGCIASHIAWTLVRATSGERSSPAKPAIPHTLAQPRCPGRRHCAQCRRLKNQRRRTPEDSK